MQRHRTPAAEILDAACERRVAFVIGELCRDDVQRVPALAKMYEDELATLHGGIAG